MKCVYTCEQCRQMDAKMQEVHHFTGYQLMEKATNGVYNTIKHLLNDRKILIVCGPGNNGGDGFALSRLLFQHTVDVSVLNANPLMYKSSEHTQLFFRQAKHEGVLFVDNDIDMNGFDIIIDCLFGTGLDRQLEEPYVSLVNRINESKAYVISVDIPSGLNGDGLFVSNTSVKADKTISIGCYKPCMLDARYRVLCGEIVVTSFYDFKVLAASYEALVVEAPDLRMFIPQRKAHSNKATYGKALCIGGSSSMCGAIALTLKSALRSGLGMITACIPNSIHTILAIQLNEVMYRIKGNDSQGFMNESVNLDELSSYDVVEIGNGLGKTNSTKEIVKQALLSDRPVILDGDAIGLIKDDLWLLERNVLTIITPHVKEMSDICGHSIESISAHPLEILTEFHQRYPHTIVLLKDDIMTITDGKEKVAICLGNNALAKGGSGDVLAGLVTGLYAQCKDGLQACIGAAMILGICSQYAVNQLGYYSVLANDIIDAIPFVLKNYQTTQQKKM